MFFSHRVIQNSELHLIGHSDIMIGIEQLAAVKEKAGVSFQAFDEAESFFYCGYDALVDGNIKQRIWIKELSNMNKQIKYTKVKYPFSFFPIAINSFVEQEINASCSLLAISFVRHSEERDLQRKNDSIE